MESQRARLNKIAPRRIRVQAALWVTELHGPDRNAGLEERLQRWIAEDPRHAAAYELASKAYEHSGEVIPRQSRAALRAKTKPARSRYLGATLAGAAILCGVVVAAALFFSDGTVSTGPGEQKTVKLRDGTRMALNANSRVLIQYDDRVRKVILAAGDAAFDVSKHQKQPFVVVIGDKKVIAMGTSFMVRREQPDGSAFAVTLVEGRVAVEPLSWPDVVPVEFATGLKLLGHGERLRFTSDETGVVDTPPIDRVTAWQRRQLIFEDTSLKEAAIEFNRYGPKVLVIRSTAVGELRVGGVFKIDDPASFAESMAHLYNLRIVSHEKTITLTDTNSRSK